MATLNLFFFHIWICCHGNFSMYLSIFYFWVLLWREESWRLSTSTLKFLYIKQMLLFIITYSHNYRQIFCYYIHDVWYPLYSLGYLPRNLSVLMGSSRFHSQLWDMWEQVCDNTHMRRSSMQVYSWISSSSFQKSFQSPFIVTQNCRSIREITNVFYLSSIMAMRHFMFSFAIDR